MLVSDGIFNYESTFQKTLLLILRICMFCEKYFMKVLKVMILNVILRK